MLHHSYSPDLATMPLKAYYDDSGTDDSSQVTVLSGPVMSEQAFVEFEGKWSLLLDSYEIPHPLHMKDFSGGGKHSSLSFGTKREIFGKAAGLINGHKFFSVSIGIPQQLFDSLLPKKVRKRQFGPYVLAFISAVLANKAVLDKSKLYGNRTISYLVDDGSGRCCTNRDGPARGPPTGSSPVEAIRHGSAEGGHPIEDRTAEDDLTPLPGWPPGPEAISDHGRVAEARVLRPALTMGP